MKNFYLLCGSPEASERNETKFIGFGAYNQPPIEDN